MTKKMLGFKLQTLSEIVNIPCTREGALKSGAPEFLYLDHNNIYGGYNLVMVDITSGAHRAFAGFPSTGGRVTAGVMNKMINSFMEGMQYPK